mgnify:CR=1 FL=1
MCIRDSVEAGGEVAEQIGQARVAVWLRDGDDAALRRVTRRLQHRLDLDRVVAVVVEHLDAVPRTRVREAPLDAGEALEAFADILIRQTQFLGHRQRRGCIRNGRILIRTRETVRSRP